jgi:hypothetical protein
MAMTIPLMIVVYLIVLIVGFCGWAIHRQLRLFWLNFDDPVEVERMYREFKAEARRLHVTLDTLMLHRSAEAILKLPPEEQMAAAINRRPQSLDEHNTEMLQRVFPSKDWTACPPREREVFLRKLLSGRMSYEPRLFERFRAGPPPRSAT